MKVNKIIYYLSTSLLTVLMLFSASMYIFNNEVIGQMFTSFGYPIYIIYPLAIAKLLGLIAIWNTKFSALKEWAYAGFFFDFVLAFFAHKMINDGEEIGAVLALLLLIVSYIYNRKVN
jgi:hypothetical protein